MGFRLNARRHTIPDNKHFRILGYAITLHQMIISIFLVFRLSPNAFHYNLTLHFPIASG